MMPLRCPAFSNFVRLFDRACGRFVVGCALVSCAALLFIGCNNKTKKAKPQFALPADGAYDASEEEVNFNVQSILDESAARDKTRHEVEDKLKKLGVFLARRLSNVSPPVPEFIADNFVGFGVDAEKMSQRYNEDHVVVGRWQASESAPQFSENGAILEFTDNVLGKWERANQFGIEFKLYKINEDRESGYVTASIVAETFGQTGDRTGLQATSLWETRWKQNPDQTDLMLDRIKVIGREEIGIRASGGQLLQDSTVSIFAGCDRYAKQLRYGLDQWARHIPGLDIVGNNGVAVGDINGDGLDDLYLCEPHGLPNLLLVQNPDGTVRDVSAKAGLDLLDETRAALIVDLDNDSNRDIAIATDRQLLLYSNDGSGKFRLEREMAIGFDGHSLAAADFDQDGDLDLFVCKYKALPVQSDVFFIPKQLHNCQSGARNLMLRNDEGWIFNDVTEQVGLTESNDGHTRSAVFVDFDLDGDQDLLVSNEFASPRLFENQSGWFSDATAKIDDATEKIELARPSRNRSVSFGQFNSDGKPDLFIGTDVSNDAFRTILAASSEIENLSQGYVASEKTQSSVWFSTPLTEADNEKKVPAKYDPWPLPSPIFASGSTNSTLAADLNNDGLDEIFVTNGYLSRASQSDVEASWRRSVAEFAGAGSGNVGEPLRKLGHAYADLIRSGFSFGGNQRNRCYLNLGRIGFANFSAASGIDLLNDARALAATDWDGDGDLDIVMTSRTGPRLRILCNQLETENKSLRLLLRGTVSNRDAIGSRVEVFVDDRTTPRVASVTAGSGNLSQSTNRLRIGLGDAKKINKVRVVWPNGKSTDYKGMLPGRSYELVEGNDKPAERSGVRFDLAIKPGWVEENRERPNMDRTVFFPKGVLPKISIRRDNEWFEVKNTPGRSLLAIFHTGSGISESKLNEFGKRNEYLAEAGVDCVSIFCQAGSEHATDMDSLQDRCSQVLESAQWPWPGGVASKASLKKTELAFGDWFSSGVLPEFPFAVLMDDHSTVKALYRGSELAVRTVFDDRMLFQAVSLPELQKLSGIEGHWAWPRTSTKLTRLKERLIALGLDSEAKRLNTASIPETALNLALHGVELASRGEEVNAAEFFDRAIALDPGCIFAHLRKGRLLLMAGSKKNVVGGPKTTPEMKKKFLENAVAAFEDALKLDANSSKALMGFADAKLELNEINPAIDRLLEYINRNENADAAVYANLGRLLFKRKRYIESAEHLTAAFDRHPTLPYVAGDLGFLYLSAGEFSQGRKFLRLANRLQPSEQSLVRFLAESEFALGNYNRALELLERVIDESPNQLRPKQMVVWLLATSPYESLRDGTRAVEMILPMLKLYEESSATMEIAAACFAEVGDFTQAVEYQKKAIELVRQEKSSDIYTQTQKTGLRERLQLFRRRVPYRTEEQSQIPIAQVGNRNPVGSAQSSAPTATSASPPDGGSDPNL